MNLSESSDELQFRETVRQFLQQHLPAAIRDDVLAFKHLAKEQYVTWQRILAAQGWGAPGWPRDYGGPGWSAVQRSIFEDECYKAGAPRQMPFGLSMIGAVLMKFGTPAQRARFLPRIITMDDWWCQGYSEPGAGSDLASLKTNARRDGDDYVINGTKTWISNGIEGSCFALLVKTNPEAQPRYSGMSLFIAPKGPGFRVGRKLEKLGYKSIDSAELIFEDYRVPADHLIGEVEGRGFTQVAGGLELGRINVAARGVGIAEGALRLATSYSQLRKTFGKPICEHQAIQLKLADMATRARAARLLTLDAADAFDRGERCDLEAGMAKYFSSEAALENSIESMRIHGAYGYSKEYDIERLYRDAPLTCIGEGTNEMQRIVIARQWVKRNAIL